jgi:hypothetical protein
MCHSCSLSLDNARICVAFNPKCQTIEEAQDPWKFVGFTDANIRGPNRLPVCTENLIRLMA